MNYTLVIGNRNYSSWSMRPWVVMTHDRIPFEEEVIPLYRDDTPARFAAFRDAPHRVPMLRHDDAEIWDSLAIVEYLAERHPGKAFWPVDAPARARARSISAEMHSGFAALRKAVPMNIRKRRDYTPDRAVAADIRRIESVWTTCLEHSGGPFLFGDFGAADAMYAPVVMRFDSIGHRPAGALSDYMEVVRSLPAVVRWIELAKDEPWVIESSE